MVEMLVGDEEIIRFGHGGVVDGLIAQLRHGVDDDFLAIIFDSDAGVSQGVEFDCFAALCGEAVGFVFITLLAA